MLRSLDFPIVMSVAESNGSVKSPAVINQIQSEKTYNLFIIEKKLLESFLWLVWVVCVPPKTTMIYMFFIS